MITDNETFGRQFYRYSVIKGAYGFITIFRHLGHLKGAYGFITIFRHLGHLKGAYDFLTIFRHLGHLKLLVSTKMF